MSGGRVVSRTFRPPTSRHPERAPDLLIGFARGYRSSDESATGIPEAGHGDAQQGQVERRPLHGPRPGPGRAVLQPKLRERRASLVDLAPTILSLFGLPPAGGATEGKALF